MAAALPFTSTSKVQPIAGSTAKDYTVKADEGKFGLSNVAATMVNLMGFAAPDMWDESIIDVK